MISTHIDDILFAPLPDDEPAEPAEAVADDTLLDQQVARAMDGIMASAGRQYEGGLALSAHVGGLSNALGVLGTGSLADFANASNPMGGCLTGSQVQQHQLGIQLQQAMQQAQGQLQQALYSQQFAGHQNYQSQTNQTSSQDSFQRLAQSIRDPSVPHNRADWLEFNRLLNMRGTV